MTRDRFLDAVLRNPINVAILQRTAMLGVPDWWLTGGAVFQTVWNVLDGRDPGAGINDYDLFYFDPSDLSEAAEDDVRSRAAPLFESLDTSVEICNEARVHLWYEQHFNAPAKAFTDTRDAIDHFVSPVCMYALTRSRGGALQVYAPHGYDDLFKQQVRPNPKLAHRDVYESKTERWLQQWPQLAVEPWPHRSGAS